MTGTPLSTALSMEGVTVLASEQETAMPSTRWRVRASTASASLVASSSLGVRTSISTSASYLAPNSLAASCAPDCAAWNTSFVRLLPMKPITILRLPPPAVASSGFFEQEANRSADRAHAAVKVDRRRWREDMDCLGG